ncbi:FAD-binding and (Fe-S)-binding domain-containing protein [Aeromicrobium ginsengisoli]|nr:FAD-binding and (Fe-S)-binding domain-containing protein [Aeromicrobium ginsengisoli]
MAHDASHFLMTPTAVVRPRTSDDVATAFRRAKELKTSVTFRSGGTSLSGQAGTSGVLLDTRRHFRAIDPSADGGRVTVEPGATVRAVNLRLSRTGHKLGPDPASEVACTVGGILANNSSGMECGIDTNAFQTIESMRVILPSGIQLDTGARDADDRLRLTEPDLYRGLLDLRGRIVANSASRDRIAQQYSMKNTMGYSLNAFTEFSEPSDILTHLMVGSEGTLAWIAEATFRTVALRPSAATALLIFPDVIAATRALPALVEHGAAAIELLDATSLRVSQTGTAALPELADIAVDQHTGLLVEIQGATHEALSARLNVMTSLLPELELVRPTRFTRDPKSRAALWKLRKGLYTAVAAARPPGSTALLEDVVVPVAALSDATADLTNLFDVHGYNGAVIFGHAKDGNLHFMINPRLDDPAELRTYEAFTEDLVDMILGHRGSLKAEHGTGRMMAPFVERQFGSELYSVMRQVKRLFDPDLLLSPGVVLTDDERIHVTDIKPVPMVNPLVDSCVECGYCEPVCPSADLTTTPRQRIALLRDISLASPADRAELESAFQHDAVATCAADSLCVTACPVGIDTGAAMKELRRDRLGTIAQRGGVFAARHFGSVVAGARGALTIASKLPEDVLDPLTATARRWGSDDWIPAAGANLPGPGPRRQARSDPGASFVLFPACVGSIFAAPADGVTGALTTLAARVGRSFVVPDAIAGLCCGTPWQSKGFVDGHPIMAARTLGALWEASDAGRLPIVCDATSCTQGLHASREVLDAEERARFESLRLVDAVTFARAELLPALQVKQRLSTVVVHPTCSSVHLGNTEDLTAIAHYLSDSVTVPDAWGCCGFAGDRGLLQPELTQSATKAESDEISATHFDAYVSSNLTCEMGMSRATGQAFEHVLVVLERLTR